MLYGCKEFWFHTQRFAVVFVLEFNRGKLFGPNKAASAHEMDDERPRVKFVQKTGKKLS